MKGFGLKGTPDRPGVAHALQVANSAPRNASELAHPVPDLQDGYWHMITLSSQPAGGKGFRMYVDGALAAQMLPNTTYDGAHAARRNTCNRLCSGRALRTQLNAESAACLAGCIHAGCGQARWQWGPKCAKRRSCHGTSYAEALCT